MYKTEKEVMEKISKNRKLFNFVMMVCLPVFLFLVGHLVEKGAGLGFAFVGLVIGWLTKTIINEKLLALDWKENAILSGLEPDFMDCHKNNGILIDTSAKKIFVGPTGGRNVFDFSQISSIGITGNSGFHINTTDFKVPKITVTLSTYSADSEAYSKLRVALGIK